MTTMRVGGPAREFEEARSTEALLALVRKADADGTPLLLLGGGSNLVVGDAGWDGLAVRIASTGVEIDGSTVTADAGVDWDGLVALTVAEGLAGLEALSAIPGTVGASPVQNVGAYGALTSDVLASVTVLDRATGQIEEWPNERCGFGSHRQSAFKHTDRYVILRVRFELRRASQSGPLRFGSLVGRLGVEPGGTAPIGDVREAVTRLRRERGSVVDPDDSDTWGVGTFFINPVVPVLPEPVLAALAAVPEDRRPVYPDPEGVKVPSGWLIENAGLPRGYGREWGRGSVALSHKHFAAVANHTGDATTQEVMRFAAHIRTVVEQRWGIRLRPECHLINCSFDDGLTGEQDQPAEWDEPGRASASRT
ncbi:MAG: UDP-N-acetylmuramate dehydrogenase [Actinobacteria bacterium]|nr:UDP-N-acetylmuramate dehydrogenase [Actinomycetota bacterium]